MNITVIGRGNVGGGLARFWRAAGHDVQELGSDGGDAARADVVLVAVPGAAIADALAKVDGLVGKPAIDATNLIGGDRPDLPSLAHQVKSIVGGPTAKAFNLNFARLYDDVPKQDVRPGSVFAADDEIRDVVETLIRDAGFDPVYGGGLDNARALEDFLAVVFASGPSFYRFWKP